MLVVDDHPVVLEGIRTLLKAPYAVVGTAESGDQALGFLQRRAVDAMLVDYSMKGLSCAELIRQSKVSHPDIRVVVLSMHDDVSVVRDVMEAGADAFVLKQDSPDQLLAALVNVMAGQRFFSTGAAGALSRPASQSEILSDREKEIVTLIVQEFNSREIAEKLFISENTVETHRKNIFRKTGVDNLVGLVKFALANGLLPKSGNP